MNEELEVKNEAGAKCGKSVQERIVMCDNCKDMNIAISDLAKAILELQKGVECVSRFEYYEFIGKYIQKDT